MPEYRLIRKKIKNIYLRVRDGEIVVTAPLQASKQQIDRFVTSHAEWIKKQQLQLWVLRNQDWIYILQKRYQIIFTEQTFSVKGQKIFCPNDQKSFRSLILSMTQDYFQNRFSFHCERMNLKNLHLSLGFYSSKWGSCHPAKRQIRLNANLAFTDLECIDSVIIHELCHLRYMNHSASFYKEVLYWMPQYKSIHRRLKQYPIPKILSNS